MLLNDCIWTPNCVSILVNLPYIMSTKTGMMGTSYNTDVRPKKTRQGRGQHTKYSATSRNKARKRYRGQGK